MLSMKHEGAFLVRMSLTRPGDFSLSVKTTKAVEHFKIIRDAQDRYFLWTIKFDSLNKLIDYHHKATVSSTDDVKLVDQVILFERKYFFLFVF